MWYPGEFNRRTRPEGHERPDVRLQQCRCVRRPVSLPLSCSLPLPHTIHRFAAAFLLWKTLVMSLALFHESPSSVPFCSGPIFLACVLSRSLPPSLPAFSLRLPPATLPCNFHPSPSDLPYPSPFLHGAPLSRHRRGQFWLGAVASVETSKEDDLVLRGREQGIRAPIFIGGIRGRMHRGKRHGEERGIFGRGVSEVRASGRRTGREEETEPGHAGCRDRHTFMLSGRREKTKLFPFPFIPSCPSRFLTCSSLAVPFSRLLPHQSLPGAPNRLFYSLPLPSLSTTRLPPFSPSIHPPSFPPSLSPFLRWNSHPKARWLRGSVQGEPAFLRFILPPRTAPWSKKGGFPSN